MLMFGWDFEVGAWSRFWICLIKICVRICDMTSRNYFGKQNSTLGSVVPLAMLLYNMYHLIIDNKMWKPFKSYSSASFFCVGILSTESFKWGQEVHYILLVFPQAAHVHAPLLVQDVITINIVTNKHIKLDSFKTLRTHKKIHLHKFSSQSSSFYPETPSAIKLSPRMHFFLTIFDKYFPHLWLGMWQRQEKDKD